MSGSRVSGTRCVLRSVWCLHDRVGGAVGAAMGVADFPWCNEISPRMTSQTGNDLANGADRSGYVPSQFEASRHKGISIAPGAARPAPMFLAPRIIMRHAYIFRTARKWV